MKLSWLTVSIALALAAPSKAQVSMGVVAAGQSADRPTTIAFAPGVTDQFYTASKRGRIWVVRGGGITGTPFLSIQDRVLDQGEGGLVGFVFDPDYQTNGYFYVAYGMEGTPFGDVVVSRFQTMPGSDDLADPMSEQILFGPAPQNAAQHKGGDLEFGPDGMLYFAYGDGDPGLIRLPSQDLSEARGKILRFDVRAPFPHVPADNPFVGTAGAVEQIWALGFRNPWRMDIDPVTGDVYVADVGTSRWEEVNRLPAGVGGLNGGWPCAEGTGCTPNMPSCTCPSPAFMAPIAQMAHTSPDNFCSITGGVVYRGSAIPGLAGQYLFTDFCTGGFRGVVNPAGSATVVDHTAQGGGDLNNIADITRDADGEVWFINHFSAEVFRLVPAVGVEAYCDSNPNSSGAAALMGIGGSLDVSAANLVLTASDLPANQFGMFLLSRDRDRVDLFGGSQGVLCLGHPIYRWNDVIFGSGPGGTATRTTDFTDLPFGVTIQPGETWNFQYWTRDVNPGVTSNTTSAVAVTFGA